jgi:hypothetical protein
MTKRTVRLALATAIVAVLRVSFGPVGVGQSEEPLDPMGASYMTGFVGWRTEEVVHESSGPGDPRVRKWVGIVVADDPRISGDMTLVVADDTSADRGPLGPDLGVYQGRLRIDKEDGAWVGTATGFWGPPVFHGREIHVLEGEGAYEGLTAVYSFEDDELEGVIVPVELPALVEPILSPAD